MAGRYFLENNQDHQLTSRKWSNIAQRCTGEDLVDTPSMNAVWKALRLQNTYILSFTILKVIKARIHLCAKY